MGVNLFKLSKTEDFQSLVEGDELLVVWNDEGETWDKNMDGKKIYDIIKIQKGSSHSPYPDEVILKYQGNIFFNFRLFLNGESNVVKEVFLLVEDSNGI